MIATWITVMVAKLWISQVLIAVISAATTTELIPERYIKPQDFNYHPITDVGIPASLKKGSTNPYALLAKKIPREGRDYPPQDSAFFPTPHPSVISRKHIETNEISSLDDSSYLNVPKNYAFSYIVKDHNSGDDFSHSQAHNGKATRGQYRVKLPDGRTQVVSYTADHKGYRADVQYESDGSLKPTPKPSPVQIPAKLPEVLPTTYTKYQPHPEVEPKHIPLVAAKPNVEFIYSVTPFTFVEDYPSNVNKPAPVQYVQGNSVNVVVKPKPSHSYQPLYTNHVSTTVDPFLKEQYKAAAHSHQYVPVHFVSSTPSYPINQFSTTVAPPNLHQHQSHQNYQFAASTVSSQPAVIVTPRPVYNHALLKKEQAPLIYRLL